MEPAIPHAFATLLRPLPPSPAPHRVRFMTPQLPTAFSSATHQGSSEAIRSKPQWAEHEPELDLALHTGLRRRSMYIHLVWENVDLESRVAIIPRTKNDDRVVVPLNDVAVRAPRHLSRTRRRTRPRSAQRSRQNSNRQCSLVYSRCA